VGFTVLLRLKPGHACNPIPCLSGVSLSYRTTVHCATPVQAWGGYPKPVVNSDPLPVPTMAGGLFAMGLGWFWESGSYDLGMHVWGAENLEMSFRLWTCGGTIETLPCMHIGHIFRGRMPYSMGEFVRRSVVLVGCALAREDAPPPHTHTSAGCGARIRVI
jgi:hypothetical protein